LPGLVRFFCNCKLPVNWRCGLNSRDHLALQLTRLKPGEEFIQHPTGLTFVFAKGGMGKCATRAESHSMAPGEILILNGTAAGKLTAHEKGEFLFWSFSVDFENLMPLFSGNEISRLHNITESFKSARIYNASHPVAVECHRLLTAVPPQFNLDHRGQLIRIAATILSLEFKEAQSQRSGYVRAEDHMIQVFESLSGSEIISLSVGELAERFSCSRRHLNRLFHQYFGLSVATLRMEMRLLKAMSLLRDPDAKIINVAEECGFNHLGLFNTCFKRRFGASPGQWRKNSFQGHQTAPLSADAKPTCPLHANGLCPWNDKGEQLNKTGSGSLLQNTGKTAGAGSQMIQRASPKLSRITTG
jgi:AraC-like DNA-binding protein